MWVVVTIIIIIIIIIIIRLNALPFEFELLKSPKEFIKVLYNIWNV